jgi:acyl-coenzyme A synthetase/AMP-(fatty) acid ligase
MGCWSFIYCIWSIINWCNYRFTKLPYIIYLFIYLVLFEGKPTIPDPGVYWRIIEKHRVSGMYSSPTALRSLRKEDPNGLWIKKSDISSLHSLSMAGERCDVPTY